MILLPPSTSVIEKFNRSERFCVVNVKAKWFVCRVKSSASEKTA